MSDLLKRFNDITKLAEKSNSKAKEKRFIPMTHSRNYKITDIGIYDSKTKRYALTDVRAHNALSSLTEMENIIKDIK